jgi:DNA modification methylase
MVEESELRIEYLSLSEILRAPRNSKGHDIGLLHQSFSRFGYVEPIVINEATGRLVAGHGRLDTLQQRKASGEKPPSRIREKDGEWFVPVLRGIAFADDSEAEAYLIASNQSVIAGGWDEAALVPMLADLATKPDGLVGVGFDGDDIDRMMRDLQRASGQPLTSQDNEPEKSEELRKKWGTELGQFWQMGPHCIFCGDSREVPVSFFKGNKIRLVWTDPPYGVSYGAKNEFLNAISPGNRIQTPISGDQMSGPDIRVLFASALKIAVIHAELGMVVYVAVPPGPLHIEFIQGLADAGIAYHHQLAWVKQQFVIGRSDYHYRHEPILYGWLENGPHYWNGDRSQDSVFEIDKPHISDLHPTTKPVELVARMIANSSQPGDIIYDPFLGSGTTLVATHQLERIGYGCEVDEGYTAVCLERLSQLGLKPELISHGSTPRNYDDATHRDTSRKEPSHSRDRTATRDDRPKV